MEAAKHLQTSSDQPDSHHSVTSSFPVPHNPEWTKDEDCVIEFAVAHMDGKSITLFEEIARRIPAKTTTQVVRRYFEKGGALHFFEGNECSIPTNKDTNDMILSSDEVVDTRKRRHISSGHVRSSQEHGHPTVAKGNKEMLANSSETFVQYQPDLPSTLLLSSSGLLIQKPATSSESSSKQKRICAELSLKSSLRATSFDIIPRNAKLPRINAKSFLLEPPSSDITELSRGTSQSNASNLTLLQRSFSSKLEYQRSVMRDSLSSSVQQKSLSSASMLKKCERNSQNDASLSEPYSLNLGRQRHETQGNNITLLENISKVLKGKECPSQSYSGKAQSCTISETIPSQTDELAPLPPSLSSFPCEINNSYAKMSEQGHEPQLCYPYQFYENQLQASNGDNWLNSCSTSINGGFTSASMNGQTSQKNTDGLRSSFGDSFDAVGGGILDSQENLLFPGNQNPMGCSSDINMSNQMMAAEDSATGNQGFDFQPWMMEQSLTTTFDGRMNNSDDFVNTMLDAQLHDSHNKYPYPFYGGFGGN